MNEKQKTQRVVIESVYPEIDAGRFPIKRSVGDKVVVEADVFAEGHDKVDCALLYRRAGSQKWQQTAMEYLVNDRWRGEFRVLEMGRYEYTIKGWADRFRTWREDLKKKFDAGQDVAVDLQIGKKLIEDSAKRADRGDKSRMTRAVKIIGNEDELQKRRVETALDEDLMCIVVRYPDLKKASVYERTLEVWVDRELARFSAWYEFFPRSFGSTPDRHGTFRDCERLLPYIRDMGFDIVYLPPIHPIGRSFRKGKNNTLDAGEDDPGSPWAIGSPEGGHKAVHPELGTLEDFRRFVEKAGEHGLEVALDIAFQCSPDHPWVEEHPQWFRWRPDGTIQYAENPPKKYQDIYPLEFENPDWKGLWEELHSVFEFWIEQGVKIFRVDNPHTKPFRFWEWAIAEIRKKHPEALFLSEAFTRPKVMYHLAKLGFTHSYTYFAWRNTKWEIEEYFTELAQSEVGEYFGANLWPNTPDILTAYLQHGGRPAFMIRFMLAATLGANYGVYGPAFELCENRPYKEGSEEYFNSEKYEIRHWDLDHPDNLNEFIGRMNAIRRNNAAFQNLRSLRFHETDNENLICFSKRTDNHENVMLMIANLDPYHTHSGWVTLDLEELGIDPHLSFQVDDLFCNEHYFWQGAHNFVQINPHVVPMHVFRVRHHVRREQDFSYY